MRHSLLGMAAVLAIFTSFNSITAYAAPPNPGAGNLAPSPGTGQPANAGDQSAKLAALTADGLAKATADLDAYLGTGPNGQHWRAYLHLDELETQANKEDQADPAVLVACWKRFNSGAPGLDLPKFAAVRQALERRWQELVAPTANKLPAAIKGAKDQFTPVTSAATARDQSALLAALAHLDAFLTKAGPNGASWKTYLHLNDLQALLKMPAGNPPQQETTDKLAAAEKAFFAVLPNAESANLLLESPPVVEAGLALRRYRQTLAAAATADLSSQFEAQLASLADALTAYQAAPSEKLAAKVGEPMEWLHDHQQADLLLAAVRHFESRPNLLVQLSEPLLAVGVSRPIDESTPVYDSILGTSISGAGRTTGHLKLHLIPDSQQAAFETRLTGTAVTKTTGQNGPATIYTTGTTRLNASTRIEVDAHGIRWQQPLANAVTSTQIDGVSAGRGGMVQNIATQRVYESKAQGEQIAAQHATARLAKRMADEVGAQLNKSKKNFLEKFRNPLIKRGEFPAELKFSTTAEAMFVRAVQADVRQLAAPNDPPGKNQDDALFVQLHESFLNNLAAGLLAGQTLREEDVQRVVIQIRGELPDSLKSDEEREPWSITFADQDPVVVTVTDNEYKIIVRGKRFTSGDRELKAMNVAATYKIEPQGDGVRLIRQGDLQIAPPDHVEGKTLTMQQSAWRTTLRRKFGKLFPAESVSEGLELPGQWQKIGKLPLRQVSAKAGWFVLGWGMPGTHNAPPAATAAAKAGG